MRKYQVADAAPNLRDIPVPMPAFASVLKSLDPLPIFPESEDPEVLVVDPAAIVGVLVVIVVPAFPSLL